jgi:AsmA protein
MSKLWKIVLIVAGALLLILVALSFLIDADQFRPMLQTKMSHALGREVKIGKLSLSIFRGQVLADEIVISDDPAFSKQPFVSAKGLRISVQLIPLITRKTLQVEAIELTRPQVMLIQNRDMRWNFSSLGGPSEPSGPPLSTGGAGAGLDLIVEHLRLTGGILILKLAGGKPQGIAIDKLEMEVHDISMTSVMPIIVSGVIQPGGKFKLDGKVGPVNKGDSALTPLEAHLTMDNLDLEPSGLVPPAAAIKGVASYSGALVSKAGVAIMNGQLRLDRLQVGANAKPAGQPVELTYHLEHDLTSHSGTLKESELRANSAVARIGGTYELKPQETVLTLNLKGQAISVDKIVGLLPAFGVVLPQGATLEGGTFSVNAKSQGTTSRLMSTGTLELNNSHLTGYSLGSAVSKAASLAGLKVGSDTLIQTFRTNFENTPEMTRLDGIQLQVQDLGNMTGAMTLDSKDNLNGKLVANIISSGGLAGAGLQKIGGSGQMTLNIPIAVTGTARYPEITADTKAVAKQAAAEAASSAVQKFVPRSTGQAAGDLIQGLLGKKKKK